MSDSSREDLTPDVLEDNWPALEVHEEHGLELRLGPVQLGLCDAMLRANQLFDDYLDEIPQLR